MLTFYQCNPELFKRCKKTHCQAECTLTTFKKYAKTDEFGNPIIASADDLLYEEQEQMTEKDKLYADELRNKALADYERLDHTINELERQTCETPRNNLETTSQELRHFDTN